MTNESDAKLIPANTFSHIESRWSSLDPCSWHHWGAKFFI